ncbi:hypothetical protein Poli38472_013259 [Pythium oligandrum]|uniref:DAGKc domain-containing protein n=1 Tax=Pythium oligandrum TaxID=41045 RepID=A0A8K1C2Q8_PYTOL|nr:hypothetical protein Poli38472_013259 [Pythium oligandrum]|eukprot:TMW55368.1 hypothetical protein Poli38472_013259 [Pythium oligandrum]
MGSSRNDVHEHQGEHAAVKTPQDGAARAPFVAMESVETGTPPALFSLDSMNDNGRDQIALMQSRSTLGTPRSVDDGELKTPPGDGETAKGFNKSTSMDSAPPKKENGIFTPRSPGSGVRLPFMSADRPSMSSGGQSGKLGHRLTFVSQPSISKEAAHELARQALNHRKISVDNITFDNPRDSNVRESIRRVQAYSRREAPIDHEMSSSVRYKKKECQLTMTRDLIEWRKRDHLLGFIDTDDLVGAETPADHPNVVRIHYFRKGRGKNDKALYRKHKWIDFTCEAGLTERWVRTVQELVRWQARSPPIDEKRKIKIVLNPHSGKRRARKIWNEDVKHFFELGNFEVVLEETTYGGHAIDMGKSYSADDGFEALVFVGGDGTLCEFMNGLLSRPEHEWREIVATTPISLISAGTQNAFGLGVGIPTTQAAVYCIIKRKMRPLDVITAISEKDPTKVHYSYCGTGWGVAGDIAEESERYRWLGTTRYAFLKLKRSVFMPKLHTGRVRHVPTEPRVPLRRYYDIRDEGAQDQFEVEEGNVYDYDRLSHSNLPRKSWGGFGGAIRSPASLKRYPEPVWREERGRFLIAGVVNTAPDGAYAHPSDGNMDLVVLRKGSLLRSLQLGIYYLMGKELQSPLMSYTKVKAVIIEQDQPENCMNIDGEVLPGPGPWRLEIVPSLFKALSEK